MTDSQISAVDVLVDDSGRLGALSYLVPAGMTLLAGDAVTVGFGRQQRHGLVLGPSQNPAKASRPVLERHGQRIDPLDMQLAFLIAEDHFASVPQIAQRFSPSSGRNSQPYDAGSVTLVERDNDLALPSPTRNWTNRTYLRPPLASPARLAALEARRLSSRGQVLVLVPTVRLLEEVLAEFSSGAARLDSKARAGAWNGWRSGTVPVGVGTRAAAFYSAAKLGGIVVVEDEHPGHVESSLPYTNARDVAKRRAALHRCPCTFISTSPTPQAMAGSKVLAVPDFKRLWPQVQVVPRSSNPVADRSVTTRLAALIERTDLPAVFLAAARPARRVCSRCGDQRPCPACTGFCAHRETVPCPRCATFGVRWSGWDRLRIEGTFPGVAAVTLTELSALPQAPRLVVVPGVDGLLSAPSLSPVHDASSVLLRAAGAAGLGGRLVLVTDSPEHPVVSSLRMRSSLDLARSVWESARSSGLPPFGHLVTVRVARETPPRVDRWPGRVYGPRRRDREWEILVKVSAEELSELRRHLQSLRARGKTRIRVE